MITEDSASHTDDRADPIEPKLHYPGDDATALDILRLASLYADAAWTLASSANERLIGLYNYPPFRLCGIHSIELFQNAFLRSRGLPNSEIRKRMHRLGDTDFIACLKLRKKTADHLAQVTANREYLVSRYAPNVRRGLSEINRLLRTIVEVEDKTTRFVEATLGFPPRPRVERSKPAPEPIDPSPLAP